MIERGLFPHRRRMALKIHQYACIYISIDYLYLRAPFAPLRISLPISSSRIAAFIHKFKLSPHRRPYLSFTLVASLYAYYDVPHRSVGCGYIFISITNHVAYTCTYSNVLVTIESKLYPVRAYSGFHVGKAARGTLLAVNDTWAPRSLESLGSSFHKYESDYLSSLVL